MDDNIKKLANELLLVYEEAYRLYEMEVNKIIKYNIKDNNYIERTLDYILSIYTEKGFYLYLKLLLYYKTVNYEGAIAYLELLKEDREEEYKEFVKNKVKLLSVKDE